MTITLSPDNIALLTDRIEAAQNSAQPIAKLTNDFPAMTVADGYAVQLELRRRWKSLTLGSPISSSICRVSSPIIVLQLATLQVVAPAIPMIWISLRWAWLWRRMAKSWPWPRQPT